MVAPKKEIRTFREEYRPDGAPSRVGYQALVWLNRRNGTGVFGISKKGVDSSSNVLLAAGDRGPFMRTTWNELRDLGYVTIEGKRLRVTDKGAKVTFMPAPYPATKRLAPPSADALDGADSVEDFDEDLDEGHGDEMEEA